MNVCEFTVLYHIIVASKTNAHFSHYSTCCMSKFFMQNVNDEIQDYSELLTGQYLRKSRPVPGLRY